jgi:hypothetical protein
MYKHIQHYILDSSLIQLLTFSYNSIKTTNTDTIRREEENPLFEQHLDIALYGLEPYYLDRLKNRISKANALTIADYILSVLVVRSVLTGVFLCLLSSVVPPLIIISDIF